MTTSQMPVIYAPADPSFTKVYPELAAAIGLNESITLVQIAFWIKQSKTLIDNEYWTYQSIRDMRDKAFSYWSTATINRNIHSLLRLGLIKEANHNTRKGDTTRWFALVIEKVKTLPGVQLIFETIEPKRTRGGVSKRDEVSQNETVCLKMKQSLELEVSQNETTLPEIFTESTQNKEIASTDAQPQTEKPQKAKAVRQANPHFDAIAKAFGHTEERKPTKTEAGRIAKAAAELKEAGYTPEQIPAIYAYVLKQSTIQKWKGFTALALPAHARNWLNSLPKIASIPPQPVESDWQPDPDAGFAERYFTDDGVYLGSRREGYEKYRAYRQQQEQGRQPAAATLLGSLL